MPRNPGLVYLYYNDLGIVPPFKQPRVQCKYCPHMCNKALNKCESHLKNCAKIDNETYQSYFGHPKITSSQVASHLLTNTSKKTLQNRNIKNFFDSITANEQDTLELEFAEAVFQCGLPFSFCELVPIQAWIKKIKPSFKLPTRKIMANQLLETVYNKTKLKVDKSIENAEFLTLICDGWYNLTNFFVYYFNF